MAGTSGTTVLFLDDSGKPAAGDSAKAVVIGGFAIPSANVPTLSRRIAGAKSRFFPHLGDPGTWEVKATNTIRPYALRRSKNRQFLAGSRAHPPRTRLHRLHGQHRQEPDAPRNDPQDDDAAPTASARGALQRRMHHPGRDGPHRLRLVQPRPRRACEQVRGELRQCVAPAPAPRCLLCGLSQLARDPSRGSDRRRQAPRDRK